MDRRLFIQTATGITTGLVLPQIVTSCTNGKIKGNLKAYIPLPIQIVIDDVGWWSGEDGSKKQQPYRSGFSRDHIPADYQAIADLGRKLGIRPQFALILCEWDRENILKELPTSTWMGEKWDNSKWVGPWLDEAARIIKDNKDYMELTLHGIGHEYWENGTFTRAEWADRNGNMRPEDQIELHIEYFRKLMDQNNLGDFPTSFVPASFYHSFGPSEGNTTGIAEVLKKHGITYINTPFGSMANKEKVQYRSFGIDAGVMTIDRGTYLFRWNEYPVVPAGEIVGSTLGLHWPNLLHPESEKNSEVIDAFVEFLKPYNDKPATILASNSLSFQHQLAHKELTKVEINDSSIEFDFTETDNLPDEIGKKELIVKVSSPEKLKFSSRMIKITEEAVSSSGDFLYTLKLERVPGKVKADLQVRQNND